jgi:hypothetical protein
VAPLRAALHSLPMKFWSRMGRTSPLRAIRS